MRQVFTVLSGFSTDRKLSRNVRTLSGLPRGRAGLSVNVWLGAVSIGF